MLKIGIDIRNLSKQITGIGRYIYELCAELSKNNNVQLYLYSPAPLYPSLDLNIFKNSILRTHHLDSIIGRQFWAETVLPFWAKQDKVDIFWGPAHRLPVFLPPSIRSVVTIHDLAWKYYPKTVRKSTLLLDMFQMPLAIRKANHIVCVSESTKQSVLKEFDLNSDKISVAYSGVQCIAQTKPKPHTQAGQNYILFIGTLEPRKNLSGLLKAYNLLDQSLKEKAPLVIAGGKGWGDVNLEREIIQLSLKPYVKLLGYVSDSELPSLYAHALFLAMPSLYEGFGTPIIEAMSYGTPVLTSHSSSMPEVAGEGGYFVDPLDISSISMGLSEMITNINLRESLSQKTLENAQKFLWRQSAQKMMNVFENL